MAAALVTPLQPTDRDFLLSSSPAPAGSEPTIQPGRTASFSVIISNWCDPSVSLPLTFSLAVASGEVSVGGLSVASTDELPPCNAPGQPAGISTTDWQSP
jgi:hypothetical protein